MNLRTRIDRIEQNTGGDVSGWVLHMSIGGKPKQPEYVEHEATGRRSYDPALIQAVAAASDGVSITTNGKP